MERERREPSVSEALSELAGIESEIRTTGAVDTEPSDLSKIREKLTAGELSPAEAIMQARALAAGRQNYH